MSIYLEYTKNDIINGANRAPASSSISYLGFNFRNKICKFSVSSYLVRIELSGLKVISRLKGSDNEKISLAMDDEIKVHCTCPDFLYNGFAYIATQLAFSLKPEHRFPGIRNPSLKGTVCKHIVLTLSSMGSFTDQIIKDINDFRLRTNKTPNRS